MTLIQKPPAQLIKEDLIRQTLEAAAQRLEREGGNVSYAQAWKRAAKLIRSLAPELIMPHEREMHKRVP